MEVRSTEGLAAGPGIPLGAGRSTAEVACNSLKCNNLDLEFMALSLREPARQRKPEPALGIVAAARR